MHRLAMAALLAVTSLSAMAANNGFDPQKLSVGIGVSRNDIPGSGDGTGTQVFVGYPFGEVAKNIKMDVELGYMDTGNMDLPAGVPPPFGGSSGVRAKGLWATGVAHVAVNPQAEFLARAGFDLGDDDGLMVGLGVGLNLNKRSQLRFEYVERDNVDSLQVNLVLRP
jgi:hypothetical protein